MDNSKLDKLKRKFSKDQEDKAKAKVKAWGFKLNKLKNYFKEYVESGTGEAGKFREAVYLPIPLNIGDLEDAIWFLKELGQVNIQLMSTQHAPYVRRWMYKSLGEPNKSFGNALYYDEGVVRLVYVPREQTMMGISPDTLFYVEAYDQDYSYTMGIEDVTRFPYDYWAQCGLGVSDVYNLLLDEVQPGEAWAMMSYAGLFSDHDVV
jgi:hypothetical protein